MKLKQRLDALTSLRFFAALMIVVHHTASYDLFGFSDKIQNTGVLNTGVSFFFVLSGFILAYVYPKLETWVEIRRFLWARIARVWPGLLASFFIAFWLLPLTWEYKTGLANLFMVNAWVPYFSYAFSYNAPSWSISTEFFFYIAFPFLIFRWEKTWHWKLLCSGIVLILVIGVINWLSLPEFDPNTDFVTVNDLLYIHPVSRIFEFIFGMFVVKMWRANLVDTHWSKSCATLYEVAAIILSILSVVFITPIAMWLDSVWMVRGVSVWLSGSGSMFAFALLIYVLAMGRGWISFWLSHPALVLLGEISFALYLLHQILLRYYKNNISEFPHLPDILSFSLFWVVLLLASYLMWALVEMPGRQILLSWGGQKKIHGTKVMRQSWHHHLNWNASTISASVALISLVALIYFSMGNIQRINAVDADNMTPADLQVFKGVQFGGKFQLRGLNITQAEDGLHIEIAWESLVEQKLEYNNALRIKDANNKVVGWGDYKQPMTRFSVKQGELWKDTVFVANNKFSGKGNLLLLGLYRMPSVQMLKLSHSPTHGGTWLLIPLKN